LNTYPFSVGNIKAIVFEDGFENLTEADIVEIVKPLPDDFRAAFLALGQPHPNSYNILYLESVGERILIDTGNGEAGKPDTGHLLELLQQQGITPEQIDKIFISHLHFDHVGGLSQDGKAVFPNAKLIVPKLDWQHWVESGLDTPARMERRKPMLQPYLDRLQLVNDGDTIAEGVKVVLLTGHTPGHSGVLVESAGERLLHIVDAMHLQMQMAFPDVSPTFDLHPDVSAKTRRAILNRIADDHLLTLTYHLPFPSLGYAEHDGAGFVWKPKVS
jgi:glyoxylase-like metal-dependent hydrolase (beta-lactamase superfamily II)